MFVQFFTYMQKLTFYASITYYHTYLGEKVNFLGHSLLSLLTAHAVILPSSIISKTPNHLRKSWWPIHHSVSHPLNGLKEANFSSSLPENVRGTSLFSGGIKGSISVNIFKTVPPASIIKILNKQVLIFLTWTDSATSYQHEKSMCVLW